MQLYQKKKNFFWIFSSIFEMYNKFEIFWKKKDAPHRFCISEITDAENVER